MGEGSDERGLGGWWKGRRVVGEGREGLGGDAEVGRRRDASRRECSVLILLLEGCLFSMALRDCRNRTIESAVSSCFLLARRALPSSVKTNTDLPLALDASPSLSALRSRIHPLTTLLSTDQRSTPLHITFSPLDPTEDS